MSYLKYLSALGLFVVAMSCAEIDKQDLSQRKKTSNVPTTEVQAGIIVGQFSASASQTQTLVASQNSNVKDYSVAISPGALVIDTAVTLKEGSDMTSQAANELGLDAQVLGSSKPVSVISNPAADLTAAMTLQIPLPLNLDSGSTGLSLTNDLGKLAILYYQIIEGQSRVGVHVLAQDDLEGAFINFTSLGFGWFQIVYFSKAVSSSSQISNTDPEV